MKIGITVITISSFLMLSPVGFASEELAQKSNCLACHSVDKKILGPSFKDIAGKYENDDQTITTLSEKVRNGGSGNWGQIPMPPNPMVSEDDAKTMVKWILSM